MAVDVVMPQMGESIAEGTVIKWMKKVGDKVERDEPMFEISTDKVDAEIPAPAAGTLSEILVEEGKTVAVNTVVARLSVDGEAAQPKPAEAKAEGQPSEAQQKVEAAAPAAEAGAEPPAQAKPAQESAGTNASPEPEEKDAGEPKGKPAAAPSGTVTSLDERRKTRSSPLVRKIARENDVDIAQLQGSGVSGRVTKKDILTYLEKPHEQQQPAVQRSASAPAAARAPQPAHGPQFAPGENLKIEPMSMMRKRIAEHMVMSRRTSAHVTTVFEVDFTEIDKLRKKHKQSYADRGANLTYLPFVVQALIAGVRQFPVLNASIDGENVVYKQEINIGIAVALDWGLIVPVLRHADEKNILGIARAINDLGERARNKKLNPDDVQGGTITITNPGIFGGLFGTPIINQPQSAILGVGGVKKRPVVIETDEGDAIVIRSMAYLALSFDHRLIDGAVADQFMARVRSVIEEGQFTL